MVKKIGSVLACAILSACAAPVIELHVTDMQGNALKTAGVSVPFTVRVTVTNGEGTPQVPGLDAFVQMGTRTASTLNIVNGKSSSTRTYIYTVRADKPGTYTLGPASVQQGSWQASSQLQQIEVGAAPQVVSQEQPVGALLELEVNKKSVMVGEPLQVKIRFLYEAGVQLVSQIVAPCTGWSVRKQSESPAGKRIIEGHEYQVHEYTLEVYRYDPGTHLLPAASATCMIPRKQRSRLDDFFDLTDWLGARNDQKQIYSTGATVVVEPLPAHTGAVHGIGKLVRVQAALESVQATVGEGIVYKIEITGSGDAQSVTAPALIVPQGLTCYESKSEILDQGATWKKVCEYIIQAKNPGPYTIPAQPVTFFDLETKQYTTMRTQVCMFTVAPSQQSGVQIKKEAVVQEQVRPVVTGSPIRTLPGSIFIWLLCLCLLIPLSGILYRAWQAYAQRHASDLAARAAYKKARAAVRAIRTAGDQTQLYLVFITLFAERLRVPMVVVTEDFMCEQLARSGFSVEEIRAWRVDFTRLSAAAFADEHGVRALCESAQQWIDRLQKRI